MARPYDDDARRMLLEAYDQGKGTLGELASTFGVSVAWAWKISAARKQTGTTARTLYRPGPKPGVDEKALAEVVRLHPDATLPEVQAELEKSSGQRFSPQHLWRVLRRMGFRLKKSRSMPPNATPKPTKSGVRSSSRSSARSTSIG